MAKTPAELKEYKRQWYLKNLERLKEASRAYLAAHREENKARCRERYQANKAEYLQRSKTYRKSEAGRAARRIEKKRRRQKHPESVKSEEKGRREKNRPRRLAYMAGYNLEHRDRLCEMHRARRASRPEEYRERSRKWQAEHPGHDKAWRQQNPDAARAISVKKTHKRRAIKKGAAVGTDRKACLARIKAIKSPEVLPCHWCGTPTAKDGRHVDHIVPLRRGGPHAAENLCCSCPRCNCSKRDSLPEEFLQRRQGRAA